MKRDDIGKWSPETLAAQTLFGSDPVNGMIVPSIHPSTTYLRDPDNQYRHGRVYSRADNPGYEVAAGVLAGLEGGEDALLFASGMAAAAAVFLALSPGDHVVAPTMMYWALRRWLGDTATRWGLEVDLVATEDVGAVRNAIRPGKTKLIWLETPANPVWSITDIAAIADLAKKAGARLAVDSTVATPILTKPIALGADIVMHSATKYLNGHSDVVAGALVTAQRDEVWARIRSNLSGLGGVLGPFEAWLLQRGMRTLPIRVKAASAGAMDLALRLSNHAAVSDVLYPGLPDFPGHEIAARQMQGGFGGMLSIRLRKGEAAAIATAANVTLWQRATSLGGVESLIEHRSSVEGPTSPVPTDLLRLSVGIESPDDLYEDLSTALTAASR
jgi:cystathionine gamma-synthase